ncbi:amidohydrolase family protein [Streptomyces sp. NPDC005548]|uniref:amidohydrolase family protein n=1 Tax=Streptomyces sp. NPDC005548 TaxID=3364724 RepID=UPI0036A8C7F2
MDARDTVLDDGILYIDRGLVDHVLPAGAPPPPGYEQIAPVETAGTAYPGLIELHNHLPYDILRLWPVPRRFENRSQWGGSSNPDYRRLVTGPMEILGEDPETMPAIVRYAEVKALVNGTTTSQGIALFSNAGSRRMYRGIVRNVEATDDSALPEAKTRIADVEAEDAGRFLARLQQPHRLLLHLAEGTNQRARDHFLALQFEPGHWAITDNLVGIHCTPLTAEDFRVMKNHGGSMVWSPLSNLLLYGQTTDVAAAAAAGILIGLGSDWSVSGSKGLLGELKAARLASAAQGTVFSDLELVSMVTRNAARILRWEHALGSLSPSRYADVIVVRGTVGDPYTQLVEARDQDISLVVINGVARYGSTGLMRPLTPDGGLLEPVSAGVPADRTVQLRQLSADNVVGSLTLAAAVERLDEALADLPGTASRAVEANLVRRLEGAPSWRIALDETAPTDSELRPRLPLLHTRTRRPSGPEVGRGDLTAPLQNSIVLDPLTAGADKGFLDSLQTQLNLPALFGAQLRDLLT